MWHWALLVVETQVQVQLHKSSLVHLPFGRHEKEKGKNINSLHFRSLLVFAFIHLFIIYIRPRGCDAEFAS